MIAIKRLDCGKFICHLLFGPELVDLAISTFKDMDDAKLYLRYWAKKQNKELNLQDFIFVHIDDKCVDVKKYAYLI